MGCCASSPAPYNGQHNASSRNPIISSQPNPNPQLGRPSTARSNTPHQPQANPQPRSDRAPAVKPNKELKRLVWESTDRTWTRRQIDKERDDFFFTRVTGRPEVWQTVKTALEVMWTGGDAEDLDGGLKTAQVILNAASITLPHSTLDKGVYDVSGNFYALPKYVVCDPTNLIVEDPVTGYDNGSKDEDVDKSEAEAVSEEENEEELRRRREEKGKGVADPDNEDIQLRARRSDAGTRDLVITAGTKDTVRQLQRKFSEAGGLQSPKRLQLYYMGRLLKDEESLLDQGWKDGHVLSAFVHG